MEQQSENKRMKSLADRLSDLPDCLIQRILSFLPATRDAIRTAVLSQRWRNQWRQLPLLTFHHLSTKYSTNMSLQRWTNFKFHYLLLDLYMQLEISRDVKELILEFNVHLGVGFVRLLESLSSHTWLVKLQLRGCTLPERVNWKHLEEFSATDCKFPNQALQNIVSQTPLLESLHVQDCKVRVPAIASKSLRKLALVRFADEVILSCPNIEELHLRLYYPFGFRDYIGTTLCGSVRLKRNGDFFAACESLKKLVLENVKIHYAEISCPKLELEWVEKLHIVAVKAVNVQSLNCVTLDFKYSRASGIKEFLAQLEHVKKLKLGRQFIKCLEVEDVLSCSLSDLQIVEIDGLSRKDRYHKGALVFVELLLKNAQMLEKVALMIVSRSRDFVSEVSRKMSSAPRCSQNATVELSCRGKQGWIKELIPMGAIL